MSASDKVNNKGQELTGIAKEKAGKLTGNESLQAKGKRDRVSGNLKQAGEKVKDVFR